VLHEYAAGTHAPPESAYPELHAVAVHAPQLVPPAAHRSSPVPFDTAQARVPAGLVHARVTASCAPHTAASVGVHARVVVGVPPHRAAPVGVQRCSAAGLLPTHSASATALPSRSRHTTARVCVPLSAAHAHSARRDSVPLSAAKPQLAVRASVPLPLHATDAEHAPHAEYSQPPRPPVHAPHAP
jgi:hypothetical protein